MRAVVSDETPPSAAVELVDGFCEDVVAHVAAQPDAETILQRPDVFRRDKCYTREVDAMLKHHEETLRNVFAVYAERGCGAVELEGAVDLMSAAQWMALMRDIGIVREV